MHPTLNRVLPGAEPVGPVALPLIAGDGRLDREEHFLVAGRRVEPFGRTHKPSMRLVQRIPHLSRTEPVLARKSILKGDDDARRLTTLACPYCLAEPARLPVRRARDALLDHLRRQRDTGLLGPCLDRSPLLLDGDGLLLRTRLSDVRDQR